MVYARTEKIAVTYSLEYEIKHESKFKIWLVLNV